MAMRDPEDLEILVSVARCLRRYVVVGQLLQLELQIKMAKNEGGTSHEIRIWITNTLT